VQFHPAWHELMRRLVAEGLHVPVRTWRAPPPTCCGPRSRMVPSVPPP
jgi:hypothetical protein